MVRPELDVGDTAAKEMLWLGRRMAKMAYKDTHTENKLWRTSKGW